MSAEVRAKHLDGQPQSAGMSKIGVTIGDFALRM
jgi:hypothetical protein